MRDLNPVKEQENNVDRDGIINLIRILKKNNNGQLNKKQKYLNYKKN